MINSDVRINECNCEDLILVFDLKSSLLSAESTLISALERKESRGAHQRSDYKELNKTNQFNCMVKLEKNSKELKISKIPLKNIKKDLKPLIINSDYEMDIKDKLLE